MSYYEQLTELLDNSSLTDIELATQFETKLMNGSNDLKFVAEYGADLLYRAFQLNNIPIMKLLIKSNADIKLATKKSPKPFIDIAIASNNFPMVQYLASIDQCPRRKMYDAISKSNIGIVNILYEFYPFSTLTTSYGTHPIHTAVENGSLELTQYILDKEPESIHLRGGSNRSTPIFIAVEQSNLPIVQLLIERGANINELGQYKHNLFQTAIINDSVKEDVLAYLLTLEPKFLEQKNNEGLTPLLMTVDAGSRTMMEFLMEHNADMTAHVNNKTMLSHSFYYFQGEDWIKTLLEKYQLHTQLNNHCMFEVVKQAIRSKQTPVAMKYNLPFTLKNQYEQNLLHWRCRVKSSSDANELIDIIMKIEPTFLEAKDSFTCTPLQYAVQSFAISPGKATTIQTLINHNVNLFVEDEKHHTILHIAVMSTQNRINRIIQGDFQPTDSFDRFNQLISHNISYKHWNDGDSDTEIEDSNMGIDDDNDDDNDDAHYDVWFGGDGGFDSEGEENFNFDNLPPQDEDGEEYNGDVGMRLPPRVVKKLQQYTEQADAFIAQLIEYVIDQL